MSSTVYTSGNVELTEIDYSTEKGPFWYVEVDGTPMLPDVPLPLEHAIRDFRREVAEAAEFGGVVEIRQCTDEDLAWAGVKAASDDGDQDAGNDPEDGAS